jgi:hypothetical protein
MAVFDIYAKRQKLARGVVPDVYQYDMLPQTLRVQLVQIGQEVLGDDKHYYDHYKYPNVRKNYEFIVKILRREFGVFDLGQNSRNEVEELYSFLLTESSVDRALSAVEMMCRAIQGVASRNEYRHRRDASQVAQGALEEINTRFREHGIGHRFESGIIVRIDSELIHSEVVKPALMLLSGSDYKGAQAEFLSAHEHYRHGKTKEALADALKSIESVLKTICLKRKWEHDTGASIKGLIALTLNNGLIDPYWQSHFTGIRTMLESGVPTVRNKMGGHGQGPEIVKVPEHVAAFAIHQTAAAIVFLVEAEAAMI